MYLHELTALGSQRGPCTADECEGALVAGGGTFLCLPIRLIYCSDKLSRQTCVFFGALK